MLIAQRSAWSQAYGKIGYDRAHETLRVGQPPPDTEKSETQKGDIVHPFEVKHRIKN